MQCLAAVTAQVSAPLRPGEIALYRTALGQQARHFSQMAGKVRNPVCILNLPPDQNISVRHAVFGDIYRQVGRVIAGKAFQKKAQPFGYNFPAHIGFGQIAADTSEPDMGVCFIWGDEGTGIVIHPCPIPRLVYDL